MLGPTFWRVRWILHAATASGEADVVARALRDSLAHCTWLELRTLVVPALGTGTGGLPLARCAEAFREVLAAHTAALPLVVRIALSSASDHAAFVRAFARAG